MMNPIELKGQPYCTDCLSWSSDGHLAVAAGEYVFILTPRYVDDLETAVRSHHPEIRWETVKIQVNQFTFEEWPEIQHQPLHSFSPGEELSNSHVTHIAWSPDGVGPFRRCVLAVQTSNLLLSIWGLEDGRSTWKRLAVVNQSLHNHFMAYSGLNAAGLQKKQRIRSFTWSPIFDPEVRPECIHPGKNKLSSVWGNGLYYYMAVANDEGDVIFLTVHPVQRLTSGVKSLAFTVINTSRVTEFDPGSPHRLAQTGSIFSNLIDGKRGLSDLAWGGWKPDIYREFMFHSSVTLLQGIQPVVYHVTFDSAPFGMVSDSESEDEFSDSPSTEYTKRKPYTERLSTDMPTLYIKQIRVSSKSESFRGPLCWDDDGLIAYSPLETSQGSGWITIHDDDQEDPIATSTAQTGDGGVIHADKVIAACNVARAGECAHAAEHLGKILFQVSNSTDTPKPVTRTLRSIAQKHADELQRRINSIRHIFDLDYDLDGKSVARIWGMAKYRPQVSHAENLMMGYQDEYLAACFTLHPTEAAEHSMPSETLMRIVIASTVDLEVDDGYDSGENHPGRRDRLLPHFAQPPNMFIPARIVDQWVRRHVRNLIRMRARRCNPEDPMLTFKDPMTRMIIYAHACCGLMDQEVAMDVFAQFNLLQAITRLEFPEMTDPENPRYGVPRKARKVDNGMAALTFEKCTICGSGIPWQDPLRSRCQRGHVFSRCGLTFLSIQDPALSKSCSNCGIEFLDETKILSMVPWAYLQDYSANSNTEDSLAKFFRVAFDMVDRTSSPFVDKLMGILYDRCPYCQFPYCVATNENSTTAANP